MTKTTGTALIGILLMVLTTTAFVVKQSLAGLQETPLTTYTVEWKGASYLVVEVWPKQLEFFLEKQDKQKFKSFLNLKNHLTTQHKELLFAMNGGMYLPAQNNEPQGLYIEQGKVRKELEKLTTYRPIKTNFYLHPNGVFYVNNQGKAVVQTNQDFQATHKEGVYEGINYATQSGPMLVINKQLHPAFTPNSKNVHLRNAVGILPNGKVCLVLSKKKICFHDIATLFRDQLKCNNALYLDGYVSKVYYPVLEEYREVEQGNFGVIIGVTKDN